MAKPDEPEYSFSFDLEYKGDEMASGGQREHRYDKLLARMKEKGLNPENFEFYLKAFRYGMPPHGGWGFGLDRVVQKLLDLPKIREALLFPRDRGRLLPEPPPGGGENLFCGPPHFPRGGEGGGEKKRSKVLWAK